MKQRFTHLQIEKKKSLHHKQLIFSQFAVATIEELLTLVSMQQLLLQTNNVGK
jgi:hypothetical protein